MSSIFLILSTLVIYVFGYRYFARYLQKTLFRIPRAEAEISAANVSIAKQPWNAASGRHEMLGFHFATIASLSTVSGAAVAVFWGWVPAFLWLLVGSSVAAGTFAIGSLWLRRRSMDSESDTGIGTGLMPALVPALHARLLPVLLLVISLALIALVGLFVYFAAILVVSFPPVTWPMVVTLALVGLLSRVVSNQAAVIGSRLPSYLVAVALVLLSIWISQGHTLGFSGSLNFDLSGHSLISVDGIMLWGVVMLLLSVFVQRQPFEAWQKSFAVLAAILTTLMLLVFYVGLAIDHPPMSAPAFTNPGAPGVLPWLFITFTSGAYAGFHFLIAYCVTAPKLNNETDIVYIGFGAALLEGLFALSAILVFGSILGDREVWLTLYQSWSALPDGTALLGHYINGVIYTGSKLAIGTDFMETFTALVLLCLSLVTSIALMRVLRVFLQELGVRYHAERLGTVKTSSWAAFGLLVLALFVTGGSDSVRPLEQLLGPTQFLLASVGLGLIARTMGQHGLPTLPVAVLLALTVLVALLGYGTLIDAWYRSFDLAGLTASVLLLVVQLGLVTEAVLYIRKKPSPPSAAPPPGTPES